MGVLPTQRGTVGRVGALILIKCVGTAAETATITAVMIQHQAQFHHHHFFTDLKANFWEIFEQ